MNTWDLLVVDADETLFDFHTSEGLALQRACETMGIAFAPEMNGLYSGINAALWAAYERREVTQEALRTLRSERFLAAIGAATAPETFGEAYIDALSQTVVVLPDAEATLRAAAAAVPVVILTNGIARVQRRRFAASPFAQMVRALAISEEIGAAKPDPRTVEAAMALGGAKDPRRVLLVGDSLSADIAAANAAGVPSCWFNPKRLPRPQTPVPTYEIFALPELLGLL